jgi:hypothetical protein
VGSDRRHSWQVDPAAAAPTGPVDSVRSGRTTQVAPFEA